MPKQGMTVERRQTKQFIDQNPTAIVLSRNVKVDDGAGGHTTGPTPLAPQTARIVMQDRVADIERRNVSGEVVVPEVKVVFLYNADVQRGDTFVWRALTMEIVWVHDFGYELVGEAARR